MSLEIAAHDDDLVASPYDYSLVTRMAAEAFGTFLLVLGIVGTATFNAANGGSILTVALAGGIMLMAGIAAVGHISGGHFNPAVTIGLALGGQASWKNVLPYWLAQFLGATVSAVVLWAIIPSTFANLLVQGGGTRGDVLGRTANGWGEFSPLFSVTGGQSEFSFVAALLIEVVIAAVFVGVILGVTSRRARVAYPAVVIGLTLGALHIITWTQTNTSFNPARSFASVVFSGDGDRWGQLWLFIVAPLVGAALAALIFRAFAPVEVDRADALNDDEETYDVVDDDIADDNEVADDVVDDNVADDNVADDNLVDDDAAEATKRDRTDDTLGETPRA